MREQKLMSEMRNQRKNTWYLPDTVLHQDLGISSELTQAVEGAEAFLFAVPTQFYRSILAELKPRCQNAP